MTVLKVMQDEEKPKQPVIHWSQALAMFVAFVVPFLLLATSARYRVFVAQAKAKVSATQRQAVGAFNNARIQWPTDDHD